MRIQTALLLALLLLICAPAQADEEKFSFHESLKPGDVIAGELTIDDHEDVTTTQDGKSDVDSSATRKEWKFEETVLAAKDGSSIKNRVKIADGSTDAMRETANADEIVTPCPFIHEDVIIVGHEDEAVTDDFSGKAGPDDIEDIHDVLNPDQDFFPEKPVFVGESWDPSDKVAKHAGLEKGDTCKVDCRLDWVKELDGRKMAQITGSAEIVQHESGRVEQATDEQITLLVDLTEGMIVKCDETAKVKYTTPADEPVRETGTSQTTYHITAKKKTPQANAPNEKP